MFKVVLLTCTDHIFNAHDRTCNRLSFHTTDPNLMLSGAQDGKMALMVNVLYTFLLHFFQNAILINNNSNIDRHSLLQHLFLILVF